MAISGTAPDTVRGFARQALARYLARKWPLLMLRGVAALLFGTIAIAAPGATLLSIILVWGAYAIVDGAFSLWAAATGSVGEGASRWWLAVVGGAGIAAGAMAWIWPGAAVFTLLIIVASWAMLTGAMQIVGALKLRKEIEHEWLLGLSGLLSLVLGVAMLTQPAAGSTAVVWVLGAFGILSGAVQVALSLRLRKLAHRD
jgi:uncharacterized membrane protein HdeD (DUF308 family)